MYHGLHRLSTANLNHITLYIQYSKIASYNFIPSLSWSYYYNVPILLYLAIFVHSFNMSKPLVYPFYTVSYAYQPQAISTHQKTFYPSVSYYTSNVPSFYHFSPALPSPFLSLPRFHYTPNKMFTFLHAVKTPHKVHKGKSSLNFFHLHLILAIILSYHHQLLYHLNCKICSLLPKIVTCDYRLCG